MSAGLKVTRETKHFPDYAVTEIFLKIENCGDVAQTLAGFSIEMPLFEPSDAHNYQCEYYTSAWGQEYDPRKQLLAGENLPFRLISDKGRSSIAYHPFFFFRSQEERLPSFLAAVCFSGNWFAEVSESGMVSCGQTKEMFTKEFQPGEADCTFSVLMVSGFCSNDQLSAMLQRYCEEKRFLPLPKTPIVAWNHWWPYEDDQMNASVFYQNVDEAKKLGFTACVLDAGWFGENSGQNHWTKVRGDWKTVNQVRFPGGIRALAEYTHHQGMQFGIWFEPEGLGVNSKLLHEHPEWEARRDGTRYDEPGLCLGNAEACEWLFENINSIVTDCGCNWVKLDYNLNLGLGCNRTDHGHQNGDGLNAHLRGYISVLQRLHEAHPELLIENCSSGGLRTDIEMLSHTHVAFLSDPDETPHSLQCFWGASGLLHPRRLYHFAWSQTKKYADGSHVFPSMEYDDRSPDELIRFHLRAAMLHQMGFSRDLNRLSERQKKIFREEIARYKEIWHPFITNPKTMLYHLTPQPLRIHARQTETDCKEQRDGCAFEFLNLSEHKAYIFLFSFAECAEMELKCCGFSKMGRYQLTNTDTGECQVVSGDILQNGISFTHIKQNTCQIWQIERSHLNETV